MRDPGGFPRAPLVALATFTAAGGASVHAQMPLPSAATPSGAELFAQQCATCHSLSPADAPRQGPALAGIYGRKAGSVAGFHYSPGYGEADFVWDEAHLDSYLTDPQAAHSRRRHALQTKERRCSQSHHRLSEGAEMTGKPVPSMSRRGSRMPRRKAIIMTRSKGGPHERSRSSQQNRSPQLPQDRRRGPAGRGGCRDHRRVDQRRLGRQRQSAETRYDEDARASWRATSIRTITSPIATTSPR